MEKRNIITFRLAEEDYQQLKNLAEKNGLTVSEYIRKQINEEPIIKVYHPREMLAQLNGIGNNINQIARHVNSSHAVAERDIEQMKRDVSLLKIQLCRLIGGADVLCR